MLLSKKLFTIPLTLALALAAACDSGYNKIYNDDLDDEDDEDASTAPPCITESAFSNRTPEAQALIKLISDLSCDVESLRNRFISGQSLGNGDEIADDNNTLRSYDSLVKQLNDQVNQRIAIASVEYEGNKLYSTQDLQQANEKLIAHAQLSGIVSVTWSPLLPWGNVNDVDLEELYEENSSSSAKETFIERLDIVFEALRYLSQQNVPVLFAPFPEMNLTNSHWYGPKTESSSDGKFRELWSFVYARAQADDGLENLLWVYAPSSSLELDANSSTWGEPSKTQYDIVAPLTYSSELNIQDYSDYLELKKPLGMTRLAPTGKRDGTFDNTRYFKRLSEEYPHIAYWIADHDYDSSVAATAGEKRSIKANVNAKELLDNSNIITTDRIDAENWLEVVPSATTN